mgnify:CR=1 FL=1
MVSVAIDGPAGAGKSTLARRLAAEMGYIYVDTGAMYRAVTYEVLRRELTEEKDIVALAAGMDMTVKPEADAMHVVVNGHDVTDYIRTPEVSARVSAVSALAGVRAAMVGIQRRQAAKGGIVLEGYRDDSTSSCGCKNISYGIRSHESAPPFQRNDGKESGHDFGRGGKRYPEKGLAGQPS